MEIRPRNFAGKMPKIDSFLDGCEAGLVVLSTVSVTVAL